jgi:hypothetical protein
MLRSKFAFKFNLCRYILALGALKEGAAGEPALSALALASDILSAPAMLAPAAFAVGHAISRCWCAFDQLLNACVR